jgi:hypothetical protein
MDKNWIWNGKDISHHSKFEHLFIFYHSFINCADFTFVKVNCPLFKKILDVECSTLVSNKHQWDWWKIGEMYNNLYLFIKQKNHKVHSLKQKKKYSNISLKHFSQSQYHQSIIRAFISPIILSLENECEYRWPTKQRKQRRWMDGGQ